ncbi:histidine-specific methyltransferase [Hypoxylon trugodes]|uniref:histidine-specific methyltransferase n=1 Tax=Hypoxylon trugodes TaxID=326681 RepID=UPI00219443C5|nr:histidine-specific methyltransferase [Hypoxylon trugodes]KAI1387345.1 histidine-specific methyltransferase [Hypoxylon trugodes]
MPSLLLWDDQGLRNFDTWTKSPSYYPKRCEWEILTNYRHDIARQFPATSVLIELGCGNLMKTAWLLAAMEKERRHVYYYALDVSDDALYKNLNSLKKQFIDSQFISIAGLSGTYDDCVEWLASSASLPASTITFLWLGNSVANMPQQDVSILLGQFHQACRKMSADCNFLISADSCADENRILKAYDPTSGSSRVFLFHGLHHANRLLGQAVFKEEEWNAIPEWDKVLNELRYSYVPKKDVHLDVGKLQVTLKRGEPIHYFMSGKWNESQVGSIAEGAGLEVGKTWRDTQKEYCFYLLQSTTSASSVVGHKEIAERSLI